MSNQSILRISRELGDIQKTADLSLAVACRDSDVRFVRAMIIGPPDTPYEYGFYEFSVKFNSDYPNTAPVVTSMTTNGGRTRFNPNIYASGKVCLSILGTWRGTRGEQWSSAQSLESILISIQSLMSSNPYENEPGFEECRAVHEKKDQADYVAKIAHENLRITVIDRLESLLGIGYVLSGLDSAEAIAQRRALPNLVQSSAQSGTQSSTESGTMEPPFQPFGDLCKRRFLWYYCTYLQTIEEQMVIHVDEKRFARMPFEGGNNVMEGKFNYTKLKKRLNCIKAALEEEANRWVTEGLEAQAKELTAANTIERHFNATKAYMKEQQRTVDLELVDGNPLHWQLLIFGQPMTNLDGGLFLIRMKISLQFPEEQPRVALAAPLFHHRVAKDGTICYLASKPADLKSHVEAIIEAIEEEEPAYDPRRVVNPEASKLFWGSAEDRKLYNRRLRRSVQDSAEIAF